MATGELATESLLEAFRLDSAAITAARGYVETPGDMKDAWEPWRDEVWGPWRDELDALITQYISNMTEEAEETYRRVSVATDRLEALS